MISTQVPFCLTDIRASLGLQYASAAACLAGLVVFAGHGLLRAATEGFALRAASGSQDKTSGLVLFNLMYGIFISTWLNEKKPDVRASRVVYSTAALSTAFFVVFGLVCGAALERLDWNALTYFAEKGTPWAVRGAALAFGWLVIASGVPADVVDDHNQKAVFYAAVAKSMADTIMDTLASPYTETGREVPSSFLTKSRIFEWWEMLAVQGWAKPTCGDGF